jgi:hypothetical protein
LDQEKSGNPAPKADEREKIAAEDNFHLSYLSQSCCRRVKANFVTIRKLFSLPKSYGYVRYTLAGFYHTIPRLQFPH